MWLGTRVYVRDRWFGAILGSDYADVLVLEFVDFVSPVVVLFLFLTMCTTNKSINILRVRKSDIFV